MRDLETDRRAGKRTLAVRLGRERTRVLYTAMVVVGVPDRAAAVGARLDDARGCCCRGAASRWRSRVVRIVRTRTDGPSLNGALAATGALQLVFCLLFAAGDPRQRRHRPTLQLELERRTLTLATPLETSYGAVRERELSIVALTDADGRRRLRRSGAARSPTTA